MNYLSIDYLILYAFLAVILVVGYRAGRNVKDMRDFAVGNRKGYGATLLLFTYLATSIGVGTVFEQIRWTFSNGILGTVICMGLVFYFGFIAFFIAPNIKYFKGCLSIAEVMGNLYGQTSRIITGFLGTAGCICVSGLGFIIFSNICETVLHIDPTIGVVVGGVIIGAYTAHGGIKSVVFTDILQFCTLFTFLILLCSIVILKPGVLNTILNDLPKDKLEIFSHSQFPYYSTLCFAYCFLCLEITEPPIFQRLLMAKDGNAIKRQFLSAAIADPTIRIVLMLIGLGGLVLYPSIDENCMFTHLIESICPVGFKGIAMAGLVAVVMGCVDSYLT